MVPSFSQNWLTDPAHLLCSADAPEGRRTACYDVDVEVDDPLKAPMHSFLMSVTNQHDIVALDAKVQW